MDYETAPHSGDFVSLAPSDICMARFSVLEQIVAEHQFKALVWPNDDPDAEPLIVDATTAKMMLTVCAALSEENQSKFKERVAKGRGWFGALAEFGWRSVRPRFSIEDV